MPVIAASKHIGTIRMIDSGSDQLSYWAASTRNTKTTASGNASFVSTSLLGEDLLQRQLGPFVAHRGRAACPWRRLSMMRDRLAGADARRRVAVDFGRWIRVVVIDDRRAAVVAESLISVRSGTRSPLALRTSRLPMSSMLHAEARRRPGC